MECGSFTVSSTGAKSIVLNNGSLVGTEIEFEMGPRSSTNETSVMRSSGWTDGTRKRVISIFDDGTLRLTRETNSYPMYHYKNVGGVATVAVSFTFTSFSTGQFDINVDNYGGVAYVVSFKLR